MALEKSSSDGEKGDKKSKSVKQQVMLQKCSVGQAISFLCKVIPCHVHTCSSDLSVSMSFMTVNMLVCWCNGCCGVVME